MISRTSNPQSINICPRVRRDCDCYPGSFAWYPDVYAGKYDRTKAMREDDLYDSSAR